MKGLIIVIVIVIFTYLNIFITNGVLFNTPSLSKNITLIQILTPIMQIILALALAYFIHIKMAKQNKSKDILIDMLDNYLSLLNEINELTIKYIREKDDNDSKDILWKLKKASISHQKFELIYKLYNGVTFTYNIEEMKNNLRELKQSITNNPFRQDGEYTVSQKILILKNFEIIETKIYQEKINLYS